MYASGCIVIYNNTFAMFYNPADHNISPKIFYSFKEKYTLSKFKSSILLKFVIFIYFSISETLVKWFQLVPSSQFIFICHV